jgi:hypothetical protein
MDRNDYFGDPLLGPTRQERKAPRTGISFTNSGHQIVVGESTEDAVRQPTSVSSALLGPVVAGLKAYIDAAVEAAVEARIPSGRVSTPQDIVRALALAVGGVSGVGTPPRPTKRPYRRRAQKEVGMPSVQEPQRPVTKGPGRPRKVTTAKKRPYHKSGRK